MKSLEQNNRLVSSVNNTSAFKMETSKETFEIFSSQIYEHKKRAIIRELSCNANDSHIDAGKRDVPFRIHFPTVFEPYFEVQDFGVGLDDFDIRGEEKVLYDADGNEYSRYMEGGIYTTYFASTKRDCNEVTGNLGLGSKSPLAYTKSMTVVARKEGIERNYVCFIGEDGKPQTTFNSAKPTDQPNGVAVRFSVSNDDFEEFRREARFVLSTFKVKPETNVPIEYILSDEELTTVMDEGLLSIDNNHEFHRHEPAEIYCNMGNVIYPVRIINNYYLTTTILVNEDAYNTGEDGEPVYYTFDKGASQFLKSMIDDRGKRFIINYPLGELSFMPSREGLSQDNKTKFNFYKRLVEIVGKELAELQQNLDNSTGPLEAISFFGKFADPWDRLASHYEYDNKSISNWVHKRPFSPIKDLIENDEKFICHYKDHRSTTMWGNSEATCIRRKNLFGFNYLDLYNQTVDQKDIVCFYVNEPEDPKGLSKAIRFYINQHDIGHRFYFFYEPVQDQVFDEFRSAFSGVNVEFRHVSELVEEVKVMEPTFFDKKTKTSTGGARVKTKNETKALVLDVSGEMSKGQVLLDLSQQDSTTCWIRRVPANRPTNAPYFYENEKLSNTVNLNPRLLTNLMTFLGFDKCIIANGTNINKIKKSDVCNLGDVVLETIGDYKDEIINQKICGGSIDRGYLDKGDDESLINQIPLHSLSFSYKSVFIYLTEHDTEFTKPLIDGLLQNIVQWRSQYEYIPISSGIEDDYTCMNTFFNALYWGEFEAISIQAKKENNIWGRTIHQNIKAVKNRYPLLFGVDDGDDAVLRYVELVNQSITSELEDDEFTDNVYKIA